MKTEFMIVQEYTAEDLERIAQWYLDKGWQIVNVGETVKRTWFAALIKEADVEEYTR